MRERESLGTRLGSVNHGVNSLKHELRKMHYDSQTLTQMVPLISANILQNSVLEGYALSSTFQRRRKLFQVVGAGQNLFHFHSQSGLLG